MYGKNIVDEIMLFVFLYNLVLSGKFDGFVVIDKVDAFLHPKWQNVLAELIVLLYKERGHEFLLTTYSPCFFKSLQHYAHEYGVASNCRYYVTRVLGGVKSVSNETWNRGGFYRSFWNWRY